MPFEIRHVRDDEEFDQWVFVCHTGFGDLTVPAERITSERALMPYDRVIAALDGERIVGTAADYPFEMTVPGGATLPVAGVTAVTVSATHRRQGILRQMMVQQLDEVAARDEPIAILNASEAVIYGRFGYGLAQLYQRHVVERAKSDFGSPVARRSRPMRLITKEEGRKELPSIYDRCRTGRPGMLSQDEEWWAAVLGDDEQWKGGGNLFVVVADADDANGTGPGYALYRIEQSGAPGDWKMSVFDLQATDPVVEGQLLRYLLDVDLIGTVTFEGRPLDCPLRWWLADPRHAKVVHVADFLWVRLLDIERSMAARRYPVDDELVVDIDDPLRSDTGGRYRIAGGPDGAECERTQQAAQLAMDVAQLGALYLGQTKPSALAKTGRIDELVPGALARADRFFGWPVDPYCATRF